ncbi:hypothetical protein IPV69_20595 [Humisphaera borealis]|uniref:PEP-CTERM sorting domain-containing protein n=2 Tax=Humisphaera borealis TaxID=2807512 RepID=A0A7M2WT33_9BACT|nr:hypothetical protein IPV69_20595 [Humisphaera borealis]
MASPFATSVVSTTGFPVTPGLYTDPSAVLGKPTTMYHDALNGIDYRSSVVAAPFGTATDQATSIVTTLNAGQSIVVTFDHDVENDTKNPFGVDFIVFGNSFFTGSAAVTPTSDMGQISILAGVNSEAVTVEVAQSLAGPWYSYSTRTGDGLFPTQAYTWDGANNAWGAESDFTKPVDPSLGDASFVGKTAAEAIALYNGSGGGAGFDLTDSGFAWIRYIRLSGDGGDVDAIADVTAVPEPGAVALAFAAGGLLLRRRTRRC